MDDSKDEPRWEPLREVDRDLSRSLEGFSPIYASRAARQYPAVNIYDAGDRYVLTAELPGLTASDFELSMTGQAVTLRGARRRDRNVPDEVYRRQERPFGTWSRTITLPSKVEADEVTASLSLGILTVVVPKTEEQRPRPIAVTVINP